MTPNILIAWRKANNLTQAQAAERLGKRRETYSRYEKGHADIPDAVTAVVMAELDKVVPHLPPAATAPHVWTPEEIAANPILRSMAEDYAKAKAEQRGAAHTAPEPLPFDDRYDWEDED